MQRNHILSIRVNEQERRMVATLAMRLQRTQSDAIRLLVREAVAQLEATPGASAANKRGSNAQH
jgi:hypothetical protein